jgi:hypothetical protein
VQAQPGDGLSERATSCTFGARWRSFARSIRMGGSKPCRSCRRWSATAAALRVYKRADKTCVLRSSMGCAACATLLLAGARCDGSAHGDCQARCLLFWNENWLWPADGSSAADTTGVEPAASADARPPGRTPTAMAPGASRAGTSSTAR